SKDVLDVMVRDSGLPLATLRVDGGAVENDFLMQFQSDLLGANVERPTVSETTALGAAYLAGLAVGYWSDMQEIASSWQLGKTFRPKMSEDERELAYAGWKKAIQAAMLFK